MTAEQVIDQVDASVFDYHVWAEGRFDEVLRVHCGVSFRLVGNSNWVASDGVPVVDFFGAARERIPCPGCLRASLEATRKRVPAKDPGT